MREGGSELNRRVGPTPLVCFGSAEEEEEEELEGRGRVNLLVPQYGALQPGAGEAQEGPRHLRQPAQRAAW